jgi:hypothetical protein
MRRPAFMALLILAVTSAAPASAAGLPAPSPAVPLAAHRALYELTFAKSRSGEVLGARGTMGYEVIDACDGWAVRQRLKMTVTNAEGQAIDMVSDYATWESKNGLHMRFHVKQMTETAVTSQTDGEATLERRNGPGEVHYTKPKEMTKALPAGTLFPMMHTAAIIQAARDGQKFLTLPLFDGTDENGAEESSVVILDRKPPAPNKWAPLSSLPSSRVRLAFFDLQPGTITPNYEVGMRYWDNGVADDLQMDFGDFVMNAKITEFALQPRRC